MPAIPSLDAETARLVNQIPVGRVTTYGDVATALGDKIASRYVGHFMLNHPHSENCPCHRVVRADGALGKFVTGRPAEKASRLREEGIFVTDAKVTLGSTRWTSFRTDQPLVALRSYQDEIRPRDGSNCDVKASPFLAGVDVSFVPHSSVAVAALVVIERSTGEMIFHRTRSANVRFPYISSYLAFRELPILRQLMEDVRTAIGVLPITLVDGSGVLHPRRCGIATMLGVSEQLTTIGVTKKRLWGSVSMTRWRSGKPQPVLIDGRVEGYALLPGAGTKKPLYVSPGNNINADQALAVVQGSLRGRRLPEPIYWADRLSRAEAKTCRLAKPCRFSRGPV